MLRRSHSQRHTRPKGYSPTIAQVAAFEALIGTIAPALDQIYDALTDDTASSLIDLAFELGDAHITTFSGQLYNFNASGEFILAKATNPGDTFQVQVRLQQYENSTTGTVITQTAAQVGTDRVTFAINRANTVWVNGIPETLTTGQTINLSGGQLTQSGANAYMITWNTGEVLQVVNNGTYLDSSVGLSAGQKAGSVEGLMGPDEGQASDFMLPNGTVLPRNLTTDQLYNTFGAAWEVTSADSLMDYGTGQSSASFPLTPPSVTLNIADLPASVVAQAASIVAGAGITSPAAVQAAEYDLLVTGDPDFVATDAAATQTASPTTAPVTNNSPGAALGVYAASLNVPEAPTAVTPITFDVYLTGTVSTATTVDWAVYAPNATSFFGAAALGGTFPSGQVTIAAGQTTGEFTVDLPEDAIGDATSENLGVEISDPGGPPVFGGTAQVLVTGPTPGAPPVPELEYLGTLGTFTYDGNNQYTLDIGAVQVSEILPALQFSIVNGATAPADNLTGTFNVETVTGFTVSGTTIPAPIGPGDSYAGLEVTANQDKFGDNTETITFNPVDTNATGFTAPLAPITVTIADTLELPSLVYSEAWGDVHIVTYNQLTYNFQQVGEFVLAESRIPGDNFEIQMRLTQWYTGAQVSVITQVAIQLGGDSVTFDWGRTDPVWVGGVQSSISAADPTLTLPGGTITEVTPTLFKVSWNTGETMTVTNNGLYDNIVDGIPGTALPGSYGGLQGEDEGQSNDFQLADGTVLAQPISTSTLYGPYAASWRVSPATSLFNYPSGESTTDFTDPNFPADVVNLSNLPSGAVAQAAAMAAAAGIVDPSVAQASSQVQLVSPSRGLLKLNLEKSISPWKQ